MALKAVRRVNEWDGPSMLKVYTPYTGTPQAPEKEPPELQDYIQRIDKYTYGLGWLLAEVECQTVGFCHLMEDRDDPKNLFSVEFQLYVRPDYLRRGVGTALWSLMRDMMEEGSRRQALARVDRDNPGALAFFRSMGFKEYNTEDNIVILKYDLTPVEENPERPTKPYLIDRYAYESSRERAAGLIRPL